MECSNKECTHVFFSNESSYVCCPACGELRKEKLLSNEFQRVQVVAKHLKIKKLEKINEDQFILSGLLLLVLTALLAIYVPYRGHHYNGTWAYLDSAHFRTVVITTFFYLVFVHSDKKLMVIKRCIGEYAWYLTTVVFKVIKLCFLLVVVFLVIHYVYPYLYIKMEPGLLERGLFPEELHEEIDQGKIFFFICVVRCIFVDIVELRKRKLCRDMIRLNSGG